MTAAPFCERCKQPSRNRRPGEACPWCWAEDGIASPLVSGSVDTATRASAKAEPIPQRQTVSIRDHAILVDEPPSLGGEDAGPDPFELIAAAVASCTSITIGIYARRHEWRIEGLEVDCQISTDPLAGRRIEVTVRFGDALTEAQRERLLVVARQCPVRRFLSSQAEFVDLVSA